jgi:hypothetical protein
MLTRTLTAAICLSLGLAASVNAAHAGLLGREARLAKTAVAAQKFILKSPMSAGDRLKAQGRLSVGLTKCAIKAGTRNPCIL